MWPVCRYTTDLALQMILYITCVQLFRRDNCVAFFVYLSIVMTSRYINVTLQCGHYPRMSSMSVRANIMLLQNYRIAKMILHLTSKS